MTPDQQRVFNALQAAAAGHAVNLADLAERARPADLRAALDELETRALAAAKAGPAMSTALSSVESVRRAVEALAK